MYVASRVSALCCLAVAIFVSPAYAYTYDYTDYGSILTTNMNTSQENGRFDYAEAVFGPDLDPDNNKHFRGILHNAYPSDGCSRLSPPPAGVIPEGMQWIAIIRRSSDMDAKKCDFIDKVLNAQRSHYGAAIIYDSNPNDDTLVQMNTNNNSLLNQVSIPSVFVLYGAGMDLMALSFRDASKSISSAEFRPDYDPTINPYKILIPMAFSFVGILLVAIIIMIVRWCQAINKRRRSRISKSQLNKLPLVRYKKDDQYDCCAICLEDYEEREKVRLLPCSHTYHRKCIDPWLLKNKRTCPVCKRRVIPKTQKRGPRRPSDSSDSDDSEAGGSNNNERTPLIPPPTGRANEESRLGAVGGAPRYGSAAVADPVPAAGLARQASSSVQGSSGSRPIGRGRRQFSRVLRRQSSSSEDISDSEHDLRRSLLAHVSMTPQSYLDSGHSLRSFTSRPTVNQSASDVCAPVPPIGQSSGQAGDENPQPTTSRVEEDESSESHDYTVVISQSSSEACASAPPIGQSAGHADDDNNQPTAALQAQFLESYDHTVVAISEPQHSNDDEAAPTAPKLSNQNVIV